MTRRPDEPPPGGEVRPFHALRYTAAAGDLAALLAPPYDMISPAARAKLLDRSPHNVVRLELPEERGGEDRFARAARTLGEWRAQGILARDERPALYLHQQVSGGGRFVRRGCFAIVRLSPSEERRVRPHEATLAGPLAERQALVRALRVQTSPVLLTYRAEGPLPWPARPPDQHVVDGSEEHRVWRLDEASDIAAYTAAITGPLYIADGHHRYATALAYRDEVRAQAGPGGGAPPEDFVLAELVPVAEMTVLAWHRMVGASRLSPGLALRLAPFFAVETVAPGELPGRLAEAGHKGTAFGLLGPGPGAASLLTVADPDAVARAIPTDRSAAWRSLDVAVLERTVLAAGLGIDEASIRAGALRYTSDLAQAQADVATGKTGLAILLNPTPVEQVLQVADAGELMPQKSTCFFPKLPTGIVLYSHT